MSEKLREALSAAVDGEASEFELRRVFDEMVKDDSLSRAWQSYHLIKQAAKGENVQGVAEMGQRIWASLDAEQFLGQDIVQEEPPAALVVEPPARSWRLAGGAVAAALALAIVVTGGFVEFGQSADDLVVPDSIAQSLAADPEPKATSFTRAARDAVAPQPASYDAVALSAEGAGTGTGLVDASADTDFDYGPGFIPYSELSAADRARSDGYFLHHVQHQAVNNDNVLSFVKMISYPQ